MMWMMEKVINDQFFRVFERPINYKKVMHCHVQNAVAVTQITICHILFLWPEAQKMLLRADVTLW